MNAIHQPRVCVVGGGPAGLMAAEAAQAAGAIVDVYEGKGSVGRKFLIAGKGGLNLTHSDPPDIFAARYGSRSEYVSRWLRSFDADALRRWARDLGIETFVGTSGRVFPMDLKAAPLLRAWVRRLRSQGVRFHAHHYCVDIDAQRTLRFKTQSGESQVSADAVVLALGGASWPQLGSDAAWVRWLSARNVEIADLKPANCGFDIEWTDVFAKRFAGQPVKSVTIALDDKKPVQGEFVITSTGVEGSLIYALSARLRDAIDAHGCAEIQLDLAPHFDREQLTKKLSQPRNGRSLTEHLRRVANIEGVKTGLLYEVMAKDDITDINKLVATIKSLPLVLRKYRPVAEAISTAGGVRFSALDRNLMLTSLPGVFCAGEMLDWEAPTGGYLLTACFASGRVAGESAAKWLQSKSMDSTSITK